MQGHGESGEGVRVLTGFEVLTLRQIFKGKDEILLSKLILEPAHSILTQSYDSRLRLVLVPNYSSRVT